jgi:hypothetical protein
MRQDMQAVHYSASAQVPPESQGFDSLLFGRPAYPRAVGSRNVWPLNVAVLSPFFNKNRLQTSTHMRGKLLFL